MYAPRIHWVARGTGTPTDRDEVNRREFKERPMETTKAVEQRETPPPQNNWSFFELSSINLPVWSRFSFLHPGVDMGGELRYDMKEKGIGT
jgi:hypothetical protein